MNGGCHCLVEFDTSSRAMSNSFRTSTCGSLTSRARATANGLSTPSPSCAVSLCLSAYTTMKPAGDVKIWIEVHRGVEIVKRALQRPLAKIQRAAIAEGERGVGAHLKHEIVVGHRVLVIALSFISKPAAVDIVGVVRIGGMGRLERG